MGFHLRNSGLHIILDKALAPFVRREVASGVDGFLASQGLAAEPTAFDGRSDYGPFIDRGIPAGGLFTGAEGIKTAQEAGIYGGTAGVPYDACYHEACDTYPGNVNPMALDQMSDAIADAVLQFAMTTSSTNGTGKASSSAQQNVGDFKGSLLRK